MDGEFLSSADLRLSFDAFLRIFKTDEKPLGGNGAKVQVQAQVACTWPKMGFAISVWTLNFIKMSTNQHF